MGTLYFARSVLGIADTDSEIGERPHFRDINVWELFPLIPGKKQGVCQCSTSAFAEMREAEVLTIIYSYIVRLAAEAVLVACDKTFEVVRIA